LAGLVGVESHTGVSLPVSSSSQASTEGTAARAGKVAVMGEPAALLFACGSGSGTSLPGNASGTFAWRWLG
jgi:hypothetical protein